MLKKVLIMVALCSVLMVSGCSSGMQRKDAESVDDLEVTISEMDVAEVESDVSEEDDVDEIGNYDTAAETERTEISETEEQSGDVSNSEASTTEEPVVNDTTKADVEPLTTEAPSETETVTTQPATPPTEPQPTMPEKTAPSTEALTTENSTPSATDDRGNPADGSPIFEITFNVPQAEYVGYDADRVARLAVEKCKAAGMIALPENLDRLLAEGKITQEEYNES